MSETTQSGAEMTRECPGYDALWLYFSLSYASWLTLPRVMMHAMPDEWQQCMSDLMNEWEATWRNMPDYETSVNLKTAGKFVKSPDWLLNYRHPDKEKIESLKGPRL